MDIQFKTIQQPKSSTRNINDLALAFDNRNVITIGREAECDITLDCDEKVISRQHALIQKVGEDIRLTDTSANGTYINNQSQAIGHGNSITIRHNDTIRLGDYTLQISIANAASNILTTPLANEHSIANQPKVRPSITSDQTDKPAFDQSSPLSSIADFKKSNVPGDYLPKGLNTPSSRRPIGQLNESFSPPKTAIPENWDTPITAKTTLSKIKTNSGPLKPRVNFADEESKLLKQLIKGLGLSQNQETELTPENMLALGRCLRASIAGMIKQRDQVAKIKSRLCFDDKNLLQRLRYSSFAEFNSSDAFLKSLLSPEQKTHSEFPLEVMKCQKEIMEDQAAIYKSYNKAIDLFREELSPFVVETLFQQKQNTSISEKLVPSIGKWEIYKQQWSAKCLNFKHIIKKQFEENIKLLHKKRIEERQIIRKNKK